MMDEEIEEDAEYDEIECPNCGEWTDFDAPACPACGHSFYPEPDEPSPGLGNSVRGVSFDEPGLFAGLSFKAILIGGLAAAGVSFGITYILGQIYRPVDLPWVGRIILFAATPAAAALGGYLAGMNAADTRQPVNAEWNSLGVGILALGAAILLDAYWNASLLRWDSLLNWGLMFLAVYLGVRWGISSVERRELEELFFGPKPSEDSLYQDLLAKARFDEERVERLVEFERDRRPHASRREHIQSAIERWQRDNR